MPLSLYSAWLQPMRMYNGGGATAVGPGGAACLPSHLAAAYAPSSQSQHQQHLGLGHLQGAAYPGHRAAAAARLLSSAAAAAAANFTDDSEDEGSLSPSSPVHDLSKSQHGEFGGGGCFEEGVGYCGEAELE